MTRARNISKILSAQETTGNVNLSGVLTATSFSGEASGLTGLAAVGAGVTILRDGSSIGAATKINFDNTFTVTDISSGISTITGASGVTTADVSTSSLVVAGVSTFSDAIRVGSAVTILTDGSANFGTQGTSGIVTFNNDVHINGCDLEFQSQGDKLIFTAAASNPGSGGAIEISTSGSGTAEISGNSNQLRIYNQQDANHSINMRSGAYYFQDDSAEYYALFDSGAVKLYHATNHGGILEQKFETDPGGVKITGVCTATSFSGDGSSLTGVGTADVSTSTLNVTGVSTFTGASNFNNTINVADDIVANFGDGSDGRIFFENSENEFHVRVPGGSGKLTLGAGAPVQITNEDGNTNRAVFDGTGASITGGMVATGIATATGIRISGNAGIITATGHVDSGITTYYGDSSYSAAGRWVLGANGFDHYTFTGPGLGYSTANDPELYLKRGFTYMFENKMGAHPFRIQSTTNGATGTQWNVGIPENDVSNGVLIFEVPFDTPDTLYYQCTSHAAMGGVINIS